MDVYDLAFFVHMLGLIGWAGLTTGAYFMMESSGSFTQENLRGYLRLVKLEILSLMAMGVSGIYMWSLLGYPHWVYPAFAVAPVLAVGEFYHYRVSSLGDSEKFRKYMRVLSPFYTVIGLLLIYDMVFKP